MKGEKRYSKGIREQILQALGTEEMTTSEIVSAVDGARQKLSAELKASSSWVNANAEGYPLSTKARLIFFHSNKSFYEKYTSVIHKAGCFLVPRTPYKAEAPQHVCLNLAMENLCFSAFSFFRFIK